MTESVTETTVAAFLAEADARRPGSRAPAAAALEHLTQWTARQSPRLEALPAGDQATVGFGDGGSVVFWRAYPGKTVEHKVVVLPGLRGELSEQVRGALAAALGAAVPGVEIEPAGHLQCPLSRLSEAECFGRFAVFLAAALAVARAASSPVA